MNSNIGSLGIAADKQYILFELEGETYGINLVRIESIERMTHITRVPDSPNHVLGIINLRGDILPVLSLRQKMGLKSKAYDADTRVIVTNTGNFRVGIVVDRVVKILNIAESDIQTTKDVLIDKSMDMLEGIYKSGESMVMLIDIDLSLDV